MAATYEWITVSAAWQWTGANAGNVVADVDVPVGASVQRVLTFGGFVFTKLLTGQLNGRHQVPVPIVCSFSVESRPTSATAQTLKLETFPLLQQGQWSQGSITDTNEAAGFQWYSPPGILNFDADARWRNPGQGIVRAKLFWVVQGATEDGLVTPDAQATGGLYCRVLVSS